MQANPKYFRSKCMIRCNESLTVIFTYFFLCYSIDFLFLKMQKISSTIYYLNYKDYDIQSLYIVCLISLLLLHYLSKKMILIGEFIFMNSFLIQQNLKMDMFFVRVLKEFFYYWLIIYPSYYLTTFLIFQLTFFNSKLVSIP